MVAIEDLLTEFCADYFEIDESTDLMKKKKLQLTNEKNEVSNKLKDILKNLQADCIPITVEGKKLYLRLSEASSKSQISSKIIQQVMEKWDEDLLKQQLTTEPSGTHLSDKFCQLFLQKTKEICYKKREVVDISKFRKKKIIVDSTKSAKKKTKKKKSDDSDDDEAEENIVKLDKASKKLVLEFYKTSNDLKEVGKKIFEKSKIKKQVCSLETERSQQIKNYLQKINPDTNRIKLDLQRKDGSEKCYFVKYYERKQTSPIKMEDYPSLLSEAFMITCENLTIDPRSITKLDNRFMEFFCSTLVNMIELEKKKTRKSIPVLSICKCPTKKVKQHSSNAASSPTNNIDEDSEVEDDEDNQENGEEEDEEDYELAN